MGRVPSARRATPCDRWLPLGSRNRRRSAAAAAMTSQVQSCRTELRRRFDRRRKWRVHIHPGDYQATPRMRFPVTGSPDSKLRIGVKRKVFPSGCFTCPIGTGQPRRVPLRREEQTENVVSMSVLNLDRLAAVDERPDSECLMAACRKQVPSRECQPRQI